MIRDPKASAAAGKTRLDLIPPAASKACADALDFGAHRAGKDGTGYGPWNWRTSDGIQASTYIAAIRRHLDAWMEREDRADDSGVHHFGHAMAGLAIMLDAARAALVQAKKRPWRSSALTSRRLRRRKTSKRID